MKGTLSNNILFPLLGAFGLINMAGVSFNSLLHAIYADRIIIINAKLVIPIAIGILKT